ncbi:hypothetical protein FACS1894164_12080 [Spirochaetia bacterium]|nr:hypothetical protein FACS1894164_12080 [Spirochaetia bacterium]
MIGADWDRRKYVNVRCAGCGVEFFHNRELVKTMFTVQESLRECAVNYCDKCYHHVKGSSQGVMVK